MSESQVIQSAPKTVKDTLHLHLRGLISEYYGLDSHLSILIRSDRMADVALITEIYHLLYQVTVIFLYKKFNIFWLYTDTDLWLIRPRGIC